MSTSISHLHKAWLESHLRASEAEIALMRLVSAGNLPEPDAAEKARQLRAEASQKLRAMLNAAEELSRICRPG